MFLQFNVPIFRLHTYTEEDDIVLKSKLTSESWKKKLDEGALIVKTTYWYVSIDNVSKSSLYVFMDLPVMYTSLLSVFVQNIKVVLFWGVFTYVSSCIFLPLSNVF